MASEDHREQPWRTLYNKLGIPVPDLGCHTSFPSSGQEQKLELQDNRFITKKWFDLERGDLVDDKVAALAVRVAEVFQQEPWYTSQNGGGHKGKCESCGNSPCTCAVFEGG